MFHKVKHVLPKHLLALKVTQNMVVVKKESTS